MTIDEAISHAREVAEEKRKSKSVNLAPEIISECELCAQEHDQLVEWLEELQQYRAIGTPEECRAAMGRLIDAVKKQPTAYDPEKVVEQLEKVAFERYENDGMGGERVVNLDDVVEIVKGGVVGG